MVDLCACPGGKATHLAALVGAAGVGGLVVACDRTYVRVYGHMCIHAGVGCLTD